ncbi:MAG: NarK/NasA family nitrate transporter [Candidatus Omnitrophica bacterium]|nr:NarK/NasA family nitrate transporter [Candidatus Omnitrophota bacterium]
MKTQLFLSTVAFGIAFALWGSVAGAAPLLKNLWGLKPLETGFLVALPVILGSLGRIPAGFLTDRWGPRLVMSLILGFSGLCALAIALFRLDYHAMLGLAMLMGVSGTTFAIGVAHVSPWYPQVRQGRALGIFGLGNLGQSVAIFGIPFFALLGSWKIGFLILGLASLIWAVIYFAKAKERPLASRARRSWKETLSFFKASPRALILSLYYFLTFGGFVAMSVYLPTLLRDQFLLNPHEAGIHTAVFILLATLMRPLGGYVADRAGGERVLYFVFLGIAGASLLLMTKEIRVFSLGALSFALSAGLGNGAIFKLVPQYFPNETGTATGLVGAAGGIGGFFPPLIMSLSLQLYGNYFLGWWGLLSFSILCGFVLFKTTGSVKKTSYALLTSREEVVS